KQSYALAREHNDARFQLDNLDYLSRICLEDKRYDLAETNLKLAEQIALQYPTLNLERTKLYQRLGILYHRIGNFRDASVYQLKYINLKDSVYSQDLTRNLMRLEAEHLEREYLATIASHKELLALNKVVIRRQDMINTITTVLVALSVGFLVLLFYSYRQKIKINKLLDRKVDERTEQLQVSERQLSQLL